MIKLDQIKEEMAEMHAVDSNRFFVDISGETLDEALANAAIQLGVSKSSIDYEILQRGVTGFFALVPKEWKIRAYETVKPKKLKTEAEEEEVIETEEAEVVQDQDGMAYVFCSADGIYLKVTPPEGRGRAASVKDAVHRFQERSMAIPPDDVLTKIVQEQSGEYVRIAPFSRIPGNDASIVVNISEDEMKAFIYATPPGAGGADLSADTIIAFLKNNRVIAGIDEERIRQFQDSPVYREEYLVAEGIQPEKGENAKIVYNFETDNTQVRLQNWYR